MKNSEKKCPLTKMTCYGEECAWWNGRECGFLTVAGKSEEIDLELHSIRRALEEGL